MAVKAYVLANVSTDNVSETLKELKKIAGISSADAVTGPYDMIIKVEAESVDHLGKLVTTKILSLKGVAKTLTCIIMQQG